MTSHIVPSERSTTPPSDADVGAPPVFSDSARLRIAWAAGALMALVIVLASSGFDPERFAYGDGLIYRYVADHFTTPPNEVHEVVRVRGTSLRYGRVGLPALIWVASAGQSAAMPYAQLAILSVAAGAACAAVARLFSTGGPLAMLLPFLAPGFALTIAGGFAEPLVLGLVLWAVVLALRERWWACAALLSLAMLTRENAGWVALGLFLWLVWQRRFRPAAILTASLIPLAGWYAFVAVRFGHVPVLDPYLRTETDTVGVPVWAPIQSIIEGSSAASAAAAALHLLVGVAAVLLARTSLLGVLAAVVSAQLLITGPFAWEFVGEGTRTAVFIQAFTILAFVAWRKPGWRSPALASAPPSPGPP